MDRRKFLQASILSVAAASATESSLFGRTPILSDSAGQMQPHPEHIDFGYTFAPPHRMTIARPEASEKTLIDLEPGFATLSWSYDDLRQTPLAIDKPPRTEWRIKMQPEIDGKPLMNSRWRRGEETLPMLDNIYRDGAGSVQLEAIGGASGALVRVTVKNTDSVSHRFSVASEKLKAWGTHSPAWMDGESRADSLVACYEEQPDRILIFGVGPEDFPMSGKATMMLEWTLGAGEVRTGWVVRPYKAYESELPKLRKWNWQQEFETAQEEWKRLLGRAVAVEIPDADVQNALYACLGDLFIMREPLADGYMGTLCGTELYRSTNPFEPCIAAIALDQMGLHAEAANGLRVHLDMQETEGNWADPKGWCHLMWGSSGMKAWSSMEHFKLTGDRAYLKAIFPRLAASARWQETQRQKSRNLTGEKEDRYGLMPRGMGDGGLMNGKDMYGVFYTHNILAVFADALAVEAASALGESVAKMELERIHETGLRDLLTSMRKGAIHEDHLEWIPDCPSTPTGSRWGALYTLFPTEILEPSDPLLTGTLKKIEQNVSPGGQPIHTGWMEDGVWVGITLDNIAETHLALGNGDAAIRYLYSSLNHGTPLFTWCEERGQEPQTKKTSGDRQHLWTPVAVVRFLRDALVMERPDGLHLGLATGRTWLEQGKHVGIRQAPTHFGEVSYRIESDVEHGVIRAEVVPPVREQPAAIFLHLRHPERKRIQRVIVNGVQTENYDVNKELVHLEAGHGIVRVEARY